MTPCHPASAGQRLFFRDTSIILPSTKQHTPPRLIAGPPASNQANNSTSSKQKPGEQAIAVSTAPSRVGKHICAEAEPSSMYRDIPLCSHTALLPRQTAPGSTWTMMNSTAKVWLNAPQKPLAPFHALRSTGSTPDILYPQRQEPFPCQSSRCAWMSVRGESVLQTRNEHRCEFADHIFTYSHIHIFTTSHT